MAENPTGGAGGFADGAAPAPEGNATIGRSKPTPVEGPAASSSGGDGTEQSTSSKTVSMIPGAAGGANGSTEQSSTKSSEQATEKDETEKLGANGTSLAPAKGDQEDMASPGAKGGAKRSAKLIGAAAAVPAAGAAGQLLVFMMFLNWLKGMAMAMLALAMNIWNLVAGLLLSAGKAIFGAFFAAGSAVSGAVGGAVSSVVAGVVTFGAGALTTVLIVASAVTAIGDANNLAARDTNLTQCTATAQTALDKVDGSDGDVDAATLANAKVIYSVLSAWGMPDENIAGIVGNWDAESGIDPTSVQGDFSSPQAITEDKKMNARDTDNGIGLGQWTFGRNSKLREYAEGHSIDWWALNTQLGFLVSSAEGGNATVIKTMISRSLGTPADAAYYFHDQWERSADTAAMKERRATYAAKWMGMFGGWSKDQSLADSILAQAGTTVSGANTARAASVRSDCLSVGTAGVTTKAGGLSLEEAEDLIAEYRVEGEDFLQNRYHSGGPGDCGYGKADNCVGFDTYFMNKFTSFQEYAVGNGIDQAASIAKATGKTTTKTPTVYSVASGPGSGAAGHVMVILGIEGDQAIIGEAACGTNHRGTRAYTRSVASITNSDWTFVDVSDLMLDEPKTA